MLHDIADAALAAADPARHPERDPNAGRARTPVHAHAYARGTITRLFQKDLKKLPDKTRKRMRVKCAEFDHLVAAGQLGQYVLRAGALVAAELSKLHREDPAEADRLRQKIGSQLTALAFEVTGIRVGILRAAGRDEEEGVLE
jgi:hypothetical protein